MSSLLPDGPDERVPDRRRLPIRAPQLRTILHHRVPERPQPPFLQWPSELAGFEDEQSFDPSTGNVYATSHTVPLYMGYFGLNASTYFSSTGEGGVPCPNCGTIDSNATIWAVNANTGQLQWHYSLTTDQGYRGQTDVSGNLIFNVLSSGDITMVDATTGQLIRDYYIGAPMDVSVSIGASVSGQEYILLPVGTCSAEAITTCPGSTPGDIVALTLQNVPPPSTSTSVSTVVSTTTTTTTTTSVSISASTATSTTVTTVVSTSSTGVSST